MRSSPRLPGRLEKRRNMVDGHPQRSLRGAAAPLPFPPLRGFPPYARRCRAATLTLAPLRVARGMAAPASATAQPRERLGAACAGGWATSPPSSRHTSWSGSTAGLRVELARWRSLALRLGLCPRREDRRGSSRRSAALSWPPAAAPPCGLRVGARAVPAFMPPVFSPNWNMDLPIERNTGNYMEIGNTKKR